MVDGLYQILFILRMICTVVSEENVIGYNDNAEKISILPFLKENCDESLNCDDWDPFLNDESKVPFNENTKIKSNKFKNLFQNINLRDPLIKDDKKYLMEFPVDDTATRMEKRFKILKQNYPLSPNFKRKLGFRSWGGKRSLSGVLENAENFLKENNNYRTTVFDGPPKFTSIEKKSKFSSWGGKRYNKENQNKNFDFNNDKDKNQNLSEGMIKKEWKNPPFFDGMKNSMQFLKFKTLYSQDLFKKFAPIRPKFQSWGGKRSNLQMENIPRTFYFPSSTSKIQFENVDGTREFVDWNSEKNTYKDEKFPKRASNNFNSWGGKRNGDECVYYPKRDPHYFNSWGGKRNDDKNNIIFMTSKPDIDLSNSEENILQRKKRGGRLHFDQSKNEDQPER